MDREEFFNATSPVPVASAAQCKASMLAASAPSSPHAWYTQLPVEATNWRLPLVQCVCVRLQRDLSMVEGP